MIELSNPSLLPDRSKIDRLEEPLVSLRVFVPAVYMGAIMELCKERRAEYRDLKYLDQHKVELVYEIPLSEILFDFYDRLKAVSRGYASYDYDFLDYRPADLVRLEILVNGEPGNPYGLTQLAPGDVVTMDAAGGGGFGHPFERDPALVERDVAQGYVSAAAARTEYGVVLDPDTGAVDEAATEALRAQRPVD